MKRIKIFCEGVTDQVFIADCLEIFYGISTIRTVSRISTQNGKKEEKLEIKFNEHCEIIEVGGCNKLSIDLYRSQLEDNSELGGINIVIFDADTSGKPNGNKGYDACSQKLKNIQQQHNVSFHYYIWPNNQTDGIIETLLKQLIPTSKEPIFHCIENHQDCLKSLGINRIKYAELKDKIGYYLYTSLESSESKKRNYKDVNFWDMSIDDKADLKKLKTFLDTFFIAN